MTERYRTAYDAWAAQQQAEPVEATGGEFQSSPRNFLPPEQRRSWTTPAGVSEISERAGERSSRSTDDDRRRANAALAREVEARSRLSGSHSTRDPRAEARVGWHPVQRLNERTGQRWTDWVRDSDGE